MEIMSPRLHRACGKSPSERSEAYIPVLSLLVAAASILFFPLESPAQKVQNLTEKTVRESIENGKQFLLQQQGDNGAWEDLNFTVGKTRLVIMTLVDCGMTLEEDPIRR
ncbi:MAG: hypothetical protein JWM11_4112, partial [Planctomycetaceae bacterium]|nr:hypothetical protein [Planctomycetaceae bacterium]